MTTIKNPLARASPLPILRRVRTPSPLKSAFLTTQTILPDILPTSVLEKRREKKRVRFALKLEAPEEDLSVPIREVSPKPSKRVIEPWREDGPLYGAYVEYLEKQDALTPEFNQPFRPPSPQPAIEPSTYTHTFVIQSKSPELVIDSITVSSPPIFHLPRIVDKKATTRKPSLPVVDPYLKQRMNAATPNRNIQSRKIPITAHNKSLLTTKRVDLALPTMKDVNPIRPDNLLKTKTVNEYFQTKKLTEIVTTPLPGVGNQMNDLCQRSIFPDYSKTSQMPFDETYFFQNHNNDHVLPVIR